MQFTCDKNLLIEGINNVQRAISTRTTTPILEGILFEVNENLILTGYDMEIGIKYTMPANIQEKGKIILNSKIIGDIVKKSASDSINFIVDKNYNVTIKSGYSKFNLHGLDAESYPVLDENIDVNSNQISLPQKELYNLIKKTIFSVSIDEKRPNLNGCLFKKENNVIEMVGIDGFRVSIADFIDENSENKDFSFIIPLKTLRDLLAMLEETGNIKITKSNNRLFFDFGFNRMISRTIAENYMNYSTIFPGESLTKIKIKTKDLLDSIERSILMVSSEDKRYPVTIKCDNEVMQITSVNNRGDFYETIDVEFNGNEIDVDINPRYLIEVLKVIEDEKIYINFNGSAGPVIIEPLENKMFSFLILPLRK